MSEMSQFRIGLEWRNNRPSFTCYYHNHSPSPSSLRADPAAGRHCHCRLIMSKRVRHSRCNVVGCTNQHKCLFSLPASEDVKQQWLAFIFDNNVPTTTSSTLLVCATHFTPDCFDNEGQFKAGLASKLTLNKDSVPTLRDPATANQPSVSVYILW